LACERSIGMRLVTVVIQLQSGIRRPIRGQWNRYLAPVGVDLAPKGSAPFLVQAIERLIFLLRPFLEAFAAIFAVTPPKLLQGKFVVDLPADDARSVGEIPGHFRGNGQRQFSIRLVAGAGETPSPRV